MIFRRVSKLAAENLAFAEAPSQKHLFGLCCQVAPRAPHAKETSQNVSDSLARHLRAMQTTRGFN